MSIDGLYIGQRRVRLSIQKIGRCGRCRRWGANVFSVKGWRHVKCVRLDESGAPQLARECHNPTRSIPSGGLQTGHRQRFRV
jgi:hypothetical protein